MPEILSFLLPALLLALLLLRRRFGFGGQRPKDYAGTLPRIDIRRHLAGPMVCEGVIYGPTGRVTSRFVAGMEGRWHGDRGTLAEHFRYAGGNEQHREWRLSLGADGAIRAEAEDIVGVARGWQTGASVVLRYRIRLPKGAGGWTLDVTDWMYLMENGTIVNRSQFRKFGLKVAELVATMRPDAGGETATRDAPAPIPGAGPAPQRDEAA